MDFVQVLRLWHENNDRIIGVLAALFILTCIILLIRTINEKPSSSSPSGNDLDLGAIEATMRKVLSTQGVSVMAGAVSAVAPSAANAANGPAVFSEPGAASEAVPASHAAMGANSAVGSIASGDEAPKLAAMASAIAERESQIAQLQAALDQARKSGNDGGTSQAETELKSKVNELTARLTEYEIIEDDIADLSLYKDENIRLRAEIEGLKQQMELAAAAGNSPSLISSGEESALKFEKTDKFGLDLNDDVMKEYAKAVDGESPTTSPAATGETAPSVSVNSPVAAAPVEKVSGASASVDQAAIDAMLNAAAAASPAPTITSSPEPLSANQPASPAVEPTVVAKKPIIADDAMIETILEQGEKSPESLRKMLETDNEKMISEVESLAEGASSGSANDALLDALDTDKLLAEVDLLAGTESTVTPQDDLLDEFKDSKGSDT